MSETLELLIDEVPKKDEEIKQETINLEKDKIDRECEEFILKQERIKYTLDKYNKGWDKENREVVNYWRDYISYCCLIYHFYSFKLRKIENFWAWCIIVFSSFASTISLFQYNEKYKTLDLVVKISITIFTLLTTLISAWMKKQNYVDNISELSKYSLKINKLKGNINAVIREPINNRMSYQEFITKYKEEITYCISVRPLISPNDWKETIYIISRYYPELAAYEYPWNKIPNYGSHAMKTYKNIKYNNLWNKFKYCYFCKFRCCQKSDNRKYKLAEKILEDNINFYKNLPRSDFDCENYNCNIYSYDEDIYKNYKKKRHLIQVV